jgi:putative heme iron utilization protein
MKPALYQEVALTRDLPTEQLKQGDIAMLIDYVPHPARGEEGAVLEIFNAIGESIAVVTVPRSAIAPLRADQVPAVRSLVVAV